MKYGAYVRFQPLQEETNNSSVPRHELEKVVHLIFPDGAIYKGAEAVLHMMAMRSVGRSLLWLYQHIPGFAWFSERIYLLVTSCRACAWKFTKILFPSAK